MCWLQVCYVLQVKPKMVMTVFAVLMSRDYTANMDSKKADP